MPLTLDNAPSTRQLASNATSLTYSFTRAVGLGVVFVSVAVTNVASHLASVTYGGEAMTKVAEVENGLSTTTLTLWRLINPSTSGAQNVVVTTTIAETYILSTAFSFSGDADSSVNVNVAGPAGGSPLANPLSVGDQSFIVIAGGADSVDVAAGTNVTSTTTNNPLTGYFGPRSGAGSTSLSITGSGNMYSLTVELKEAGSPVVGKVASSPLRQHKNRSLVRR